MIRKVRIHYGWIILVLAVTTVTGLAPDFMTALAGAGRFDQNLID